MGQIGGANALHAEDYVQQVTNCQDQSHISPESAIQKSPPYPSNPLVCSKLAVIDLEYDELERQLSQIEMDQTKVLSKTDLDNLHR